MAEGYNKGVNKSGGYPPRKKETMKRLIAFLLVSAMVVLGLASCGGGVETSDSLSESVSESDSVSDSASESVSDSESTERQNRTAASELCPTEAIESVSDSKPQAVVRVPLDTLESLAAHPRVESVQLLESEKP